MLEQKKMKMNKKALAILSSGHLVTDINQGALPALLPFFKAALNLSYTMSGTILLAANLTSSIIQPVFGHLSDKRPIGWLLPLSPFIALVPSNPSLAVVASPPKTAPTFHHQSATVGLPCAYGPE